MRGTTRWLPYGTQFTFDFTPTVASTHSYALELFPAFLMQTSTSHELLSALRCELWATQQERNAARDKKLQENHATATTIARPRSTLRNKRRRVLKNEEARFESFRLSTVDHDALLLIDILQNYSAGCTVGMIAVKGAVAENGQMKRSGGEGSCKQVIFFPHFVLACLPTGEKKGQKSKFPNVH